MAFEDIDKEIKPLSNESVLEKMLVGFQLNGLTMKKYYETNGDTEGLKYFNLWNRLVNPNLSTMTLVQVKEQVKLLSHRDVHEIESEIQQLDKKRWIQQYQSKPVFQELVKDIRLGDDPAVQLNQLLLNFKRIGPTNFAYTMDATSYENFLNGTKGGDCNTLVHAFKAIAENYLGLPVKNNDSGKIGFPPKFKTPRKETIDGVSGNVDAGKFWVFENHFWIEYEGETYDVLFGVKEHVNSSSWIKMTAKENGAEVYEGTKVWINPSRSDTSTRYTTTDPN